MNWCLCLRSGKVIKFKSMLEAIKHAEHHNIRDCTIEGPALDEINIMRSISEVESAGFKIEPECFLANFDGKVN